MKNLSKPETLTIKKPLPHIRKLRYKGEDFRLSR